MLLPRARAPRAVTWSSSRALALLELRQAVSWRRHSRFFQCMGNEMAAGSSSSKAFVEKEIADNKVVVFS